MQFDDYAVVSDLYRLEECRVRIHAALEALTARIGHIRALCRYHRKGTRTLENDYIVKRQVLGSGVTGVVRLALGRHLKGSTRFAVQSIDLRKVISSKAEAQLVSELEIFMTLDHPHIVQLVDLYEAQSELHLVMECMDGGELFDRLIERKVLANDEAAETIRQVLLCVSYLHDMGIVHRDVKMENFLYHEVGGSHLKLTDFGFSTWWKEGDVHMQTPCGTLCYTAPEVLNTKYTRQCDLWSVGVIAFTLLAGYLPFHGTRSRTISTIKACKYWMDEERWKGVSENARKFVLALLKADHQQRLSAREALEHPWLQEPRGEPEPFDISGFLIQSLCKFQQASTLQRFCASIASLSHRGGSMHMGLRNFFMEMSTSGKGVIKLEDFKRALSGKSSEADEDGELLDNIFRTLDDDHDGCLSYSEFLAVTELMSDKYDRGTVVDIFRRFDTKNAGYISKDDVEGLLGSTSEHDENVQQILEELQLHRRARIPYQIFEACLANQPGTYLLEHIPEYQEEPVKKQRHLPGKLEAWHKQIFGHLERYSMAVAKYAVDPSTMPIETDYGIH
mmetsp:Transcript_26674/g.47069  ORF Transcript_26674/g.47069 Transcript_26674/m.47069 type:complete len:563 (-) Transcript_26674:150-1838(-)